MADLIDTLLSAAEIATLPERLRWRLWAGEIGHGVAGLTVVERSAARHDARSWLQWGRDLKPGAPVDAPRYGRAAAWVAETGVSLAAHGLDGEFVSIAIDGFADRFLVRVTELMPA